MSAPLHPRCESDTCIRCRKKFKSGDRVHVVNIIEKLGANPNNLRERGAWFSGEFEVAHVSCGDPELNGGIIGAPT